MVRGRGGMGRGVYLEMGVGDSGGVCYLRDIWCTNVGFRSISEMLPQQRADELLPLGLMHPLGVRGYDRLAEVLDAREALLPCRCGLRKKSPLRSVSPVLRSMSASVSALPGTIPQHLIPNPAFTQGAQ